MRLFLDTNILIDIIANREPWVKEALILVQLASMCKLTLVTADYSFINIAYITRKQFSQEELYKWLEDLKEYVEIAVVGEAVLSKALKAQWNDFEDCVQCEIAVREKADYIITRNAKDFSLFPIQALSPRAFLESYL